MAEFCYDCYKDILDGKKESEALLFSKETDLCEGCGSYKRVVIRELRYTDLLINALIHRGAEKKYHLRHTGNGISDGGAPYQIYRLKRPSIGTSREKTSIIDEKVEEGQEALQISIVGKQKLPQQDEIDYILQKLGLDITKPYFSCVNRLRKSKKHICLFYEQIQNKKKAPSQEK